MEGAVRVTTDASSLSTWLAGIELALAVLFFCAAILYVRPAKRAARRAQSARS
jgi:uncharacterized membrane protein